MTHPKKLILAAANKILWTGFIRKPASAFLARHPKLKQSAKKIVLRYFIGPQPQALALENLQLSTDERMFKTSATYQNLLNLTLQNNTYNIHQTSWVNKFLIALAENNYSYLKQYNIEERRTDLITACYLYLLRRYPCENDIDLLTEHLNQGASVESILNSLMGSPEFENQGIYYLREV